MGVCWDNALFADFSGKNWERHFKILCNLRNEFDGDGDVEMLV